MSVPGPSSSSGSGGGRGNDDDRNPRKTIGRQENRHPAITSTSASSKHIAMPHPPHSESNKKPFMKDRYMRAGVVGSRNGMYCLKDESKPEYGLFIWIGDTVETLRFWDLSHQYSMTHFAFDKSKDTTPTDHLNRVNPELLKRMGIWKDNMDPEFKPGHAANRSVVSDACERHGDDIRVFEPLAANGNVFRKPTTDCFMAYIKTEQDVNGFARYVDEQPLNEPQNQEKEKKSDKWVRQQALYLDTDFAAPGTYAIAVANLYVERKEPIWRRRAMSKFYTDDVHKMIARCSAEGVRMLAEKKDCSGSERLLIAHELKGKDKGSTTFAWTLPPAEDGSFHIKDLQFWDFEYQYSYNRAMRKNWKTDKEYREYIHKAMGIFDALKPREPRDKSVIEAGLEPSVETIGELVTGLSHRTMSNPNTGVDVFRPNDPYVYRVPGLNTWVGYIHYHDRENGGEELRQFYDRVYKQDYDFESNQPVSPEKMSKYPDGKEQDRYHKQIHLLTIPNTEPEWATHFKYAFPENLPRPALPGRPAGHAVVIAIMVLCSLDGKNPNYMARTLYSLQDQEDPQGDGEASDHSDIVVTSQEGWEAAQAGQRGADKRARESSSRSPPGDESNQGITSSGQGGGSSGSSSARPSSGKQPAHKQRKA